MAKVALVTGASRGIGKAVAQSLAQAGITSPRRSTLTRRGARAFVDGAKSVPDRCPPLDDGGAREGEGQRALAGISISSIALALAAVATVSAVAASTCVQNGRYRTWHMDLFMDTPVTARQASRRDVLAPSPQRLVLPSYCSGKAHHQLASARAR